MSTEAEAPKRRPRRRWLRYSLRTLLVVVTLAGVVLGLAGNRAERQRRAVAAIRTSRGWVEYDYQQSQAGAPAVRGELPGPDWICRLLGVDYFARVTRAEPDVATDATAAHLAALTSLQGLSLSGTEVSDTGLAHLSGLTSLRWLDLDGTQVSDAGLVHLTGLTRLEAIWLDRTQVGDAGLGHLRGLTALEGLDLEGTKVSDAGLVHLSGLTSLKWLDLRGTRVSDAGLMHLSGLTSLEELSLSGTQVSDDGCRRLNTALPNCTITR